MCCCPSLAVECRPPSSMIERARTIPTWLAGLSLALCLATGLCSEQQRGILKQTRETNPFNFVRLVIMRLVYGMAKMMGFEESLSEVANGAFVPPGVDDDYGGFDLDTGDRDYYDDYY